MTWQDVIGSPSYEGTLRMRMMGVRMILCKGLMVVSLLGKWMKDTACRGKDFFGTVAGTGKDTG